MLPGCWPPLAAQKLEQMNTSCARLQDQALVWRVGSASLSLEGHVWVWGSLAPEILGHELVLPERLGHLSSPSVTRLCYTLLQQLPLGSGVELGAESRLLTGFLN